MTRRRFWVLPVLIAGVLAGGRALAKAPPPKVHRAVFELTTDNPQVWMAALHNIENARKRFAPEPTELELVADGPGIGIMLRTDTALAERMQKMFEGGVAFAACHNTMQARHLTRADLLPFVTVVPSGVGEVILRQEEGWAYLKSGF